MTERAIDIEELRGLKSKVNSIQMEEKLCKQDKELAIKEINKRIDDIEQGDKDINALLVSINEALLGTLKHPETGYLQQQKRIYNFFKGSLIAVSTSAVAGFFIWFFTYLAEHHK